MYRLVIRTQASYTGSQFGSAPPACLFAAAQAGKTVRLHAYDSFKAWLDSDLWEATRETMSAVAPGIYATDLIPGSLPGTYEELLMRLGVPSPGNVPPDEQPREIVDAIAAE